MMQLLGRGVAGFLFGHTLAVAYLDNLPVMFALFAAYVIAIAVADNA